MIDVKRHIKGWLLNLAKQIFSFRCSSFPSIISNDCFGGEIYRSLNLPYNTPFIGLMIMAPCYLKLLKNLEYYLDMELYFVQISKYDFINELLKQKGYFPIASIGNDIEIQFLHYKSEVEAKRKWEMRKGRVDKKNLLVKFDFSKDFSNEDILNEFLSLKYDKMIAIGSTQFKKLIIKDSFVDMPEYTNDGAVLFRLSLKYVDYKKLLFTGSISRPSWIKGVFLSKFLNNSWNAQT